MCEGVLILLETEKKRGRCFFFCYLASTVSRSVPFLDLLLLLLSQLLSCELLKVLVLADLLSGLRHGAAATSSAAPITEAVAAVASAGEAVALCAPARSECPARL